MPNKKAKQRKLIKRKKNLELIKMGRTRKQIKRKKRKQKNENIR